MPHAASDFDRQGPIDLLKPFGSVAQSWTKVRINSDSRKRQGAMQQGGTTLLKNSPSSVATMASHPASASLGLRPEKLCAIPRYRIEQTQSHKGSKRNWATALDDAGRGVAVCTELAAGIGADLFMNIPTPRS